jgi:hypothetical protein
MKFKYFALIGIATLLIAGCAPDASSNLTNTEENNAKKDTINKSSSTEKTGTFQAAEHPTQGTARVVTENGKSYIEFDSSFKTDNGPDLFVILHRSDAPPISGIKEQDYVSIARLQNTSGTQRYDIPENVNLQDFKSVAVWCRQFNATFGYAPLSL